MNYRELRRLYEVNGPARTVQHLREALEARQLRSEDFSFRTLAEALLPDGREWVLHLDPRRKSSVNLLEATNAVDMTAFSNVTSQLLYSKIMEGYQQEAFIGDQLVETIPTRLDGEKIPSAENLADEVEKVEPGMAFPQVGFGEDYVETPGTDKRGLICAVSREAIFFDRTGLVLRNAFRVGEVLGLNREKRILDVVLGISNPYKWKGATYNTYQSSTPWVNDQGSNPLNDWKDVDESEQVFSGLLDPATGEPVVAQPSTILVMPSKLHTARNILNAVQIRIGDGASGSLQTVVPGPFQGYRLLSSRLAYRRLLAAGISTTNAAQHWYHGDFKRAFAYMENWPITVTQAPPNHHDEFERDIVLKVKASERGAAAVLDPRYVVKNYDQA